MNEFRALSNGQKMGGDGKLAPSFSLSDFLVQFGFRKHSPKCKGSAQNWPHGI